MPYTPPTVAQFRARYPVAFPATVDDAVIEAALAEALSQVDTEWIEADYQPAIMAYAAHMLTTEGVGATVAAQFSGFRSLQIGSLALTRSDSGGREGTLEATVFGQRYLELLSRNKGGPRVIRAGANQNRV